MKNLRNEEGIMPMVSRTKARKEFAALVKRVLEEINEDRAKLKKANLEGQEKEDPIILSWKIPLNKISKCSSSRPIFKFDLNGVDKKYNISDGLKGIGSNALGFWLIYCLLLGGAITQVVLNRALNPLEFVIIF